MKKIFIISILIVLCFALIAEELKAIHRTEPKAPENVTIRISGDSVIIEWDPVIVDIYGNPITIAYYNIYYSTRPNSPGWILLGSTTNSTYTEITGDNKRFYIIRAYSMP